MGDQGDSAISKERLYHSHLHYNVSIVSILQTRKKKIQIFFLFVLSIILATL